MRSGGGASRQRAMKSLEEQEPPHGCGASRAGKGRQHDRQMNETDASLWMANLQSTGGNPQLAVLAALLPVIERGLAELARTTEVARRAQDEALCHQLDELLALMCLTRAQLRKIVAIPLSEAKGSTRS